MKALRKLPDLQPDQRNANRGTKRGRDLLEHSLQTLGAGRSIVVDRNGVIIGGNKTFEEFGQLTSGDGGIVVVQTTGHELVVVQRTDLDMLDAGEAGRRARELAIADNRIAAVDLEWDPEALLQAGAPLEEYFDQAELAALERKAEAEWVTSGTRTERESEGNFAKSDGNSPAPRPQPPPAPPADRDPAGPRGDKPRTIHECPKCGAQW